MLAACSSANIDNKEAVRTAMIEYLQGNAASTGLDMSSMDVNVDAVVFENDMAHATVSFTIKGTDQGMQGNYSLERQGDKWGNVKRQDLTAAPHGMPDSGTVPSGAAPPTPPTLPPGITTPGKLPPPSTNTLPSGHPAIPGQAK